MTESAAKCDINEIMLPMEYHYSLQDTYKSDDHFVLSIIYQGCSCDGQHMLRNIDLNDDTYKCNTDALFSCTSSCSIVCIVPDSTLSSRNSSVCFGLEHSLKIPGNQS